MHTLKCYSLDKSSTHCVWLIIDHDQDQIQGKLWQVHLQKLKNVWALKPGLSFYTVISFASWILQNSCSLSLRGNCLVHMLLCPKLLFMSFAFGLSHNDAISMQRRSNCPGDCEWRPEFHFTGTSSGLFGWLDSNSALGYAYSCGHKNINFSAFICLYKGLIRLFFFFKFSNLTLYFYLLILLPFSSPL